MAMDNEQTAHVPGVYDDVTAVRELPTVDAVVMIGATEFVTPQ